ncbi:hypothetical protein DL98DRAFT_572836 [Cadophora sp. DSE1049]|nr:hypothetical protein DL98DRAFT_572836 [Cadophora sp. DSE1049]
MSNIDVNITGPNLAPVGGSRLSLATKTLTLHSVDNDRVAMRQSFEDDGASYKSYHSDEEKPLISRIQRYNARTPLGPVPSEAWKWDPLIPRRIKKPKPSKNTSEKPLTLSNSSTEENTDINPNTNPPAPRKAPVVKPIPPSKATPAYRTWRHFIISRQSNLFTKIRTAHCFDWWNFDFCPQLGEDHDNVLKYNGDDVAMLSGEKCRMHGGMGCFCVEFRWKFGFGYERCVFDFVEFARLEGVSLEEREQVARREELEWRGEEMERRQEERRESSRISGTAPKLRLDLRVPDL